MLVSPLLMVKTESTCSRGEVPITGPLTIFQSPLCEHISVVKKPTMQLQEPEYHLTSQMDSVHDRLKARFHKRFLSRQLDAIFVALKLHQVSNMCETSTISWRQIV